MKANKFGEEKTKKGDKSLFSFLNMGSKHWVVFLTFIVLGSFLIWISKNWSILQKEYHDPVLDKYYLKTTEFGTVLHELGILFVTIVPIIFVYERVLRNSFLIEMKEQMDDVISAKVPEYIENIRESGINDVFLRLRYDLLIKKLEKTANTKIKILKIWIPSIESLKPCLRDLIANRNCEVEIILLNPACHEAMEKRGKQCNYTKERIGNHIIENLRELSDLYLSLPDEKKTSLNVKLHSDFISLSLIGIENYFWVGFYLNGRVATEGTQLKVHGRGAFFYQEVYKHYKYQWNNAVPVDLTDSKFIESL